jgi:erythronate-4-phosphate dehydrogenase
MDEALSQDIVSLHVPLTFDGPCPTHQMINRQTLKKMHQGALLVNSSRGDVTDGGALLESMHRGHVHAALDVWPGEPGIDTALLDATIAASPHVAGYSVEGKQNGTLQIYAAFCRWLEIEAPMAVTGTGEQANGSSDSPAQLARLIIQSCDVVEDDLAIRRLSGLPPGEVAAGFDQLRKTYRLRHDVDTQLRSL